MKLKKNLYCPKCEIFPDKIIEKYLEPIEETRLWDGMFYQYEEGNIDDVEFDQLCWHCNSRLEDKGVET